MGLLFDLIRQQVTARQVADQYGLSVNRYGKALCPWHSDRNPSLSFDKRTGRCKCFACNCGGSAIDLAAILLNMTALEAAKQINADFQLGCDDVQDKHRPIRPKGVQSPDLQRREQEEDAKRYSECCAKLHQLRQQLAQYTPESAEASPEFTRCLQELADIQVELENMSQGKER